MKLRGIYTALIIFASIKNGFSFQKKLYNTLHNKICKKVRVEYKLFIKKNKEDVITAKEKITKNVVNIVTDDISNDILYYLKFYHLTNDNENSYFYIIFYELINLSVFSNRKERLKNIPISVANILLYLLIKNIILHNILHHK
uniref:Uncharacterized protein n=1 Tax=Florenciella sp. virus SA2 TaxID=3240092 RepID=A0AB39J9M4_9VIRU